MIYKSDVLSNFYGCEDSDTKEGLLCRMGRNTKYINTIDHPMSRLLSTYYKKTQELEDDEDDAEMIKHLKIYDSLGTNFTLWHTLNYTDNSHVDVYVEYNYIDYAKLTLEELYETYNKFINTTQKEEKRKS